MDFSTPNKVRDTISAGDQVERNRSLNRSKIHSMFNGAPSLGKSDAAKLGLRVNFNTNEAAVLGQHGRRQYSNAFNSRSRYFKVSLPDAPTEYKDQWGIEITNRLARIMKRSRPYYEMHRAQWASVLLDGCAPKKWRDNSCWYPKFIALRDFRVPTDTECSLEDLGWYGVRRRYTYFTLAQAAFGKNSNKGWNKPGVAKILKQFKDVNVKNDTTTDWATEPEKVVDIMKQNGAWCSADALPRIPIWEFNYYDEDAEGWKCCAIPDYGEGIPESSSNEFLFKDAEAYAPELDQCIHVQFGDLNSSPPFLYHEVRSLGFLLMEPCFWSNVLTCRLIQHCMDNMNSWLRGVDPTGKGRAQVVELMNRGWLPEGISVVPQQERHQINPDILTMTQDRMKSLIQEVSISYTQDTQSRQSPEETATAVMARVSTVNAMMSGLLNTAFNQEYFCYVEICRRFCLKGSIDKDVKKFQEQCLAAGVPEKWLDVERWEVEPEIPLGNGNPTMEMMQSQALFDMRGSLPPQAQQEVLHERIQALTGDPKKAQRLVPLDGKPRITDAQRFAEIAFSVLMEDVPIQHEEGLNPIDQAQTLLGLLAGKVVSIEQNGNVGTAGDIAGMNRVAGFITELLQQASQDEQLVPVAKEISQALGKLMNTVKAFQQRLAQQQQSNGQNGEAAAALIKAQSDAQIKEALAQQKMVHKEQATKQKQVHTEEAFVADQNRKNDETAAQIRRDGALALAEEQRKALEAATAPAQT